MSLLVSTSASGAGLPRSTPESQGVRSSGVLDFINAADATITSLHGFMLVRHGQVVAEGWWTPYSAQSRHALYSLSKSFTSTAVGLAVAEGKLSTDDPVLKFYPEDAPAKPSENLKAMRVRDLLTMSTGHHGDDLAPFTFFSEERPTKVFLSLPVAHKPGTLFAYNTPATYMQSAIVQKLTGEKIIDYLRPRLFQPLGIDDPTWAESSQGISQGGTGLAIRTEDIARFGQLYLQKGMWNGKQLIPAAWVEQATSKQVSNGSNPSSDWDQGYGFQFWRCRHGFYRGDGAFGQFCIVMPELDAVVAINSGTNDLGGVMNLVWDKLVPAITPGTSLPADDEGHAKLTARLAGLNIPTQSGEATSPLAGQVSEKVFTLPAKSQSIQTVQFIAGKTDDTLVVRAKDHEHRVTVGRGRWMNGRSTLAQDLDIRQVEPGDQPHAASGAWTRSDTYVARICFIESPVTMRLQLRFGGDFVVVDVDQDLAFAPTTRPQVVGEAK